MIKKSIVLGALSVIATFAYVPFIHADTAKNHQVHNKTSNQSKIAENEKSSFVKMTVESITNSGDKKLVRIKLVKALNNAPLTLNDLKEVHTKKIHFLIVDDKLKDYSHVHPRITKKLGVYEFEWQPKTQGNYRIWADLLPLETQTQEYVTSTLSNNSKSKPTIDKTVSQQSTMEGLTFKLLFDDSNLQMEKAAMGKIVVTDAQGQPVKDLEPIMGAFAHIVGFWNDFKTITHIHPIGEEPSKSTDRGGPEFEFHFDPERAGFIKLFAQFKIKGKELIVPFGIMVKPRQMIS